MSSQPKTQTARHMRRRGTSTQVYTKFSISCHHQGWIIHCDPVISHEAVEMLGGSLRQNNEKIKLFLRINLSQFPFWLHSCYFAYTSKTSSQYIKLKLHQRQFAIKTTNIASSDVVSLQFICGIIMEYSWMLMLQLISIYKPSLPPLHSHFLQWEESVEAINCLLWIENINKPHITRLPSKWQTCIIILYCLTRGLLISNLCLNTNWAPLNVTCQRQTGLLY